MQRVFTSKVHFLTWVLLAVIAGLVIWGGCTGQGLVLAFSLVLAAVVVERVIHSRYVIDAISGLTILKGRFSRPQAIPLHQIMRIDIIRWPAIGRFALRRYLLLVLRGGKEVAVTPAQEETFVDCIMSLRAKSALQDNDDDENGYDLTPRHDKRREDPFMDQLFNDDEED